MATSTERRAIHIIKRERTFPLIIVPNLLISSVIIPDAMSWHLLFQRYKHGIKIRSVNCNIYPAKNNQESSNYKIDIWRGIEYDRVWRDDPWLKQMYIAHNLNAINKYRLVRKKRNL